MTQDIAVLAIVVVVYLAGLVAFRRRLGPYREMDASRRRYTIVIGIIGALLIIALAVNVILSLTR